MRIYIKLLREGSGVVLKPGRSGSSISWEDWIRLLNQLLHWQVLKRIRIKPSLLNRAMPLSDQMIDTILNSSISQKLLEDFSIFQIYSENQIINKLKDLQELNDPSGIYALSTIMFE